MMDDCTGQRHCHVRRGKRPANYCALLQGWILSTREEGRQHEHRAWAAASVALATQVLSTTSHHGHGAGWSRALEAPPVAAGGVGGVVVETGARSHHSTEITPPAWRGAARLLWVPCKQAKLKGAPCSC